MNERVREASIELPSDFLDMVAALNDQRVEYVLVGGYALAVHGIVRATADIDFLYRRTKANVRRLCVALVEFGAPANVIDPDALLTPDIVTQFGRPPHRIDLLNAIDGIGFNEVWAGATEITIDSEILHVIGRAELVKNKQASARETDIADLKRLMARRGGRRRA